MTTKPRATRSAFAVEAAILDEKEAAETDSKAPKKKKKRKRKTQISANKRQKSDKVTHSNEPQAAIATSTPLFRPSQTQKKEHGSREPCTACGSLRHNFSRCFLVRRQDKNKDWLPKEAWDTFANHMKEETFKKRVKNYRKNVTDYQKGLTAIKEAADQ